MVSKEYSFLQTIAPQWSPDGSSIIYRWNKEIRVLNVGSYDIIRVLKHADDCYSPKFSPNGKYLAVGSGTS